MRSLFKKEGEHWALTAVKTISMMILPILVAMCLNVLHNLDKTIAVVVTNQVYQKEAFEKYEASNNSRCLLIEKRNYIQDGRLNDHENRMIILEHKSP